MVECRNMINLQVGVKAFLKNKEGKYLIVHRAAKKYGKTSGSWDIVGGRIEPGTSLFENLRREVKEEVNLDIISEPILIQAQDIIPSEERHIVRLTYSANCIGDLVIDEEEHDDYKWLDLNEIKELPDLDIYVKDILSNNLIN